jgi:hypothetical protein
LGERRCEWETCMPKNGFFPQISQTAAMAQRVADGLGLPEWPADAPEGVRNPNHLRSATGPSRHPKAPLRGTDRFPLSERFSRLRRQPGRFNPRTVL